MHHVFARDGKLDSRLHEVVAYRNLPTVCITSACDIHLLQIVGIALNQNWNTKLREFKGVCDTFLISKIGQANEHTINLISMLTEQRGAFARIGMRLDAAELGILFAQL